MAQKKSIKKETAVKPIERTSDEDLFYKKWAFEFPKENIQILNDSLGKVLTFSLAFFSFIVAFYDKLGSQIKFSILLLLFASAVISFYGIMPLSRNYNPYFIKTVKDSIADVTKVKMKYLIRSSICLMLTMLLIILDVGYTFIIKR